jgi:hypothetical protein
MHELLTVAAVTSNDQVVVVQVGCFLYISIQWCKPKIGLRGCFLSYKTEAGFFINETKREPL